MIKTDVAATLARNTIASFFKNLYDSYSGKNG